MSADKSAAAAVEDHQAPVKLKEVGNLFAATYAFMVNTEGNQHNLYRLYGKNAEFNHVTPEGQMSAKTVNNIKEVLGTNKSLASDIHYTSINVQGGEEGCVVVLATGIQTPPASKPRTFSQVFVLVPQPEGFYCNNDIFRVTEAPSEASAINGTDAPAITTNGTANGTTSDPDPSHESDADDSEVTEDEAEEPEAEATPVTEAEAPAPPADTQEAAATPATPVTAAPVPAPAPATPAPAPAPAVEVAPVRMEPMSYASLAAQPKSARPHVPKAPAKAMPTSAPVAKERGEENGTDASVAASKPATQRQGQERSRSASNANQHLQNQVFIRPVKMGTQEMLTKVFSEFGQVDKVQLKEQGFGFVTFHDTESVTKAIAVGELMCEEQRVTIEGMKPQKPASAGRTRGRNVRAPRGAPLRGDGESQAGRRSSKSKASVHDV